MRKNTKTKSGFTLIEALIFLAIFCIIVVTFYSTFTLGMNYIIESKNKIKAVNLANEKMEMVRNIKYEYIGVAGGIPDGNILQTETIAGTPFAVKTYIKYFDDSLDGVSPADLIPNDCKIVKIEVNWEGLDGENKTMSLSSRFAPEGEESNDSDEGVLSINVSDLDGNKISQSNVHIVNTDVSPNVDVSDTTDSLGSLVYPGVKESIRTYEITLTKSGYETVQTYASTTSFEPEEAYRNASVFRGQPNEVSLKQSKVADLKITSKDFFGDPVPNVSFSLGGGKLIGKTVPGGENVYNMSFSNPYSTGASGEKSIEELSSGSYTLSDLGTASGYTRVDFSAVSLFSLSPDESKTININFAKNDVDSLIVEILGAGTSMAVSGSQVRLKNDAISYDVTKTTSADGIAFFPEKSSPQIPLAPGTYDLEIKASGFNDNNSQVTISAGSGPEEELINLTPST